jgi:hypothetical protein
MRYKVLFTDRAESDTDSALLWFREQRASDAGKRWFGLPQEKRALEKCGGVESTRSTIVDQLIPCLRLSAAAINQRCGPASTLCCRTPASRCTFANSTDRQLFGLSLSDQQTMEWV